VNPLATATATAAATAAATASTPGGSGLSVNLFWVIVAALNFLLFLALIWVFGFHPIAKILDDRKKRIMQGLDDAYKARKDRDAVTAERAGVIAAARRDAHILIAEAQKSAQELRDADIAATREELGRLRDKAASDIAAERDRALADLRVQVADLVLATAGKVVGESMTDARQRRLVDEFLAGGDATEGRQN
jgi:F-type H+-transporting ATPase subunit b